MKRPRQGSLYLMVLLLTSLLLIMGMAYLSSSGPQATASQDALATAQAYQLARSGIEEARLKLAKDNKFPPGSGQESRSFTYSETLRDGDKALGTYRVTVDTSRTGDPQHLYQLTARGYAGKPGQLGAEAEIRCWLSDITLQVVRWDE